MFLSFTSLFKVLLSLPLQIVFNSISITLLKTSTHRKLSMYFPTKPRGVQLLNCVHSFGEETEVWLSVDMTYSAVTNTKLPYLQTTVHLKSDDDMYNYR